MCPLDNVLYSVRNAEYFENDSVIQKPACAWCDMMVCVMCVICVCVICDVCV